MARTKAQLEQEISELRAKVAQMTASESHGVQAPWQSVLTISKAFPDYGEWEQEKFLVISLNSRMKAISTEIVAVGTVSKVETHPREVFRTAIRANAFAIVVAHNHPSGEFSPSDSDYEITTHLVEAGKILGVPVVDHVILTSRGYFSFASEGLL